MKIKVIANYLKESGLVCEKLDDQTTFWYEVNHITEKLKKMSAHDFMKLIVLSLDDSREEEHKFLSMFDKLVGENKHSKRLRLLRLFCNLMALYDKFTPEDKNQIDLQVIKLNEHLYNLQPADPERLSELFDNEENKPKSKRALNLSAVGNKPSSNNPYAGHLRLFVKSSMPRIKGNLPNHSH